ncbi:hypothetical protein ASF61_00810 [Duganella sp. Leaf126]|uniref:helix-turn-helix domain-containing protein n=1 Tax=Duganella sp. Leaf126 TaxID=1736266 RepID=UPI0006F8FAE8|nr:helix-turn-helix domain-containing protein [Duganella sp. Leaf126]KQQ47227.1 hypothetical protein ASF61_00810 [Duganella sp. Leaf126]
MTLQMVADDVGESIANAIAKRLVIASRRPGYLAQVSAVIAAHEKADPDFSALLVWLRARLSQPVDVAAMAAQVAMSPRTFHRKFTARFGQTPARFVETLRLEHAQSLLRGTLALKFIARQCGYADFSQFAKAYQRRFGISPDLFRQAVVRTTAPIAAAATVTMAPTDAAASEAAMTSKVATASKAEMAPTAATASKAAMASKVAAASAIPAAPTVAAAPVKP